MSNYSTLKSAIQSVIRTNGNQEITGAILQSTLLSTVDSIGADYLFAGIATPQTDAGSPDQNVFWIGGAGTYTNFGSSYVVNSGELGVFMYNGSWSKGKVTIIEIVNALNSSATDKALAANQGKILNESKVGKSDNSYYECAASAWSATKGVTASGFVLSNGISIYVKMTNPHAQDSDVSLNINSTGVVPLYYHGSRANAQNTWGAGDVILVTYDGANYQSFNVSDSRQETLLYAENSSNGSLRTINCNNFKLAKGMLFRVMFSSRATNNTSTDCTIALKNNSLGGGSIGTFVVYYNGSPANQYNTWADGDVVNMYYDGTVMQSFSDYKAKGISNLWMMSSNAFISRNYKDKVIKLSESIIDIVVNYPDGRPSELSGLNFVIQAITNTDIYLSYFSGTGTISDTYRFKIGYTANSGIVYIEATKEFTTSVKVGLLVDTNRLGEVGGLSTAECSVINMVINEKSVTPYKIPQNEDDTDEFDGYLEKTISDNILRQFNAIRYVDILPYTSNSRCPLTKIGIFTPTGHTSTTLTFSAEDAACLNSQLALVCKMEDGSYKICQFSAASGNTITLLYDYGTEIDLEDVVGCMSIHDTISGGNGQHLSPWAYKALGEIIPQQLNSKHCMSNEPIGGFIAACCSDGNYRESRLTWNNGNDASLGEPNSLWKFGGRTGIVPSGQSQAPANASSISSNTTNRNYGNWWHAKALWIVQGVAGAKMTYPFKVGRKFKGFVKIGGCNPKNDTYDGSAQLKVYGDETLISTISMSEYADNYYIDIDNFVSEIRLEVEILENKNTFVTIGYVVIYENYSNDINPINSDSIVAIQGSSNTQYPPSNASYIDLVAGDPFNEMVIQPDGVTGDGYGYWPKELQKATTCQIGNWGKSGATTVYGMERMFAVFKQERYTHSWMSYFANDLNANTPQVTIMRNMWKMCQYAQAFGAIPFCIQSYGTASSTQSNKFGKFHDYLQWGVWNPFVLD